jgi:hypothetical protein
MRYMVFLLPLLASAQPAEGDKVTQALISEIQQLRLAIERSTLLNARTQLAVSQLQLQETTMARVNTQWNEVRTQGSGAAAHRKELAATLHDLEDYRTKPEFASGDRKLQLEGQIRETQREIDRSDALETARASRESELAAQVQASQAAIAESRARIAEMERALDTAIQQLLKK